MAAKINGLETWLNDIFARSTPRLPSDIKKTLVEWTPVIGAIMGVLTILASWSLWHWARIADAAIYYAGAMCAAYSGYACPIPMSRFSIWLWLGVFALCLEGLLYLFAYPKLKRREKKGWDYLYYGLIANVAYVLVSLFTSYDTFAYIAGALVGSTIGLYLLFQIREAYLGQQRTAPTKLPKKSDRN